MGGGKKKYDDKLESRELVKLNIFAFLLITTPTWAKKIIFCNIIIFL